MVGPDTAPAFPKKKNTHACAAKLTMKMSSFSPVPILIQRASGNLLVSCPKKHNERNAVPTSPEHENPYDYCFSVCVMRITNILYCYYDHF